MPSPACRCWKCSPGLAQVRCMAEPSRSAVLGGWVIRETRSIKVQRRMPQQRDTPADTRTELVTRVFLRFQRSLLKYLRDLLARREDAEEVAQETYVRLVRAGSAEQSEMHIRASMFRAATNLAYDRFRQRRA